LATDFSDLSDTMSEEQINKLASVYNHVDDIDLYIAGLMETPVSGSLLGPTFSCIIADQVSHQKFLGSLNFCFFEDAQIKSWR